MRTVGLCTPLGAKIAIRLLLNIRSHYYWIIYHISHDNPSGGPSGLRLGSQTDNHCESYLYKVNSSGCETKLQRLNIL